MIRMPIGVLDSGNQGIDILNSLTNRFKNEIFLYMNDYDNYPYEGKEIEEINRLVKANVEYLLECNIKILIIISDSIVEYCREYLQTIPIPVINIVDSIIEYVNKNYEQKNLALLTKEHIAKANLYQKNFKYNHLYNLPSDTLEDIIFNKQIKTAKSFNATHEVLKTLNKKEIDLFIYSAPFIKNLIIEITEYATFNKIIDLGEVICEEVVNNDKNLYLKGKSKLYVISNLEKKQLIDSIYWFKDKFKYINKGKNKKHFK